MKTKNDYLLDAKVALSNAKRNGSEMVNLWDNDFASALFSLIYCINVKNLDTAQYMDNDKNVYSLYENSRGTGTRISYIGNDIVN